MSISFDTLFSIRITHDYYSGVCADFEYLISSEIAQLLRDRRVIQKINKGTCYFYCEKDGSGVPLLSVSGTKVRIGLKLNNPYFTNFTNLTFKAGTIPVYRNLALSSALDQPVEMVLVNKMISYSLTKTGRPLSVTLKNAANDTIAVSTVTNPENTTLVSFDLSGNPSGSYAVIEKVGSSSKKSLYYFDSDLAAESIFGIVEIALDDTFLSVNSPEFVLNFNAREETLKYYIVGKNYTPAELNQLLVTDAGYVEDARSRISFNKVNHGSFSASDIKPSLLSDNNTSVILFKSQHPVAKFEKSRRKIQLMKSSDVLLKNLPLPGINQPKSDIIIQISKP